MSGMTDEAFWKLIERATEQRGDREERTEWLSEELSRLPHGEIVDFQIRLSAVRLRADSWDLWVAAGVIHEGSCSDDSFWYFQLWLLSLGRQTFERVVADADVLADVEAVRKLAARSMNAWSDEDWPEWETLDYAAASAYQDATGREDGLDQALDALGLDLPVVPNPADVDWNPADPATVAARLPRLTLLFGAKVA
jgi:hypothetical protein